MKDKSRFLSSVIVSLLAGFIYYMFGQDINENVQSSIKAALSSNDIEQYMPYEYNSFSSSVKNSGSKLSKKKSKFYIKKKNTIEFEIREEIIPGDELFADYVLTGQAKFQKPIADKNIDFTSELDNLIRNDNKNTCTKNDKKYIIAKSFSNSEKSVSDTKGFNWKSNDLERKFEGSRVGSEESSKTGKGFEFNYQPGEFSVEKHETAEESGSSDINIYFAPEANFEDDKCNKFKVQINTKNKNINGNKIKIMIPKIQIEHDHEIKIIEPDPVEINIDEDSCGDDSM